MTDATSSAPSPAVESSTAPEEKSELPTKFELFPKLPPELRLKIWKLVPEYRVVEVIFKQDHRKNNYKFLATIPAILHANHDARVEGLRRYKQVFKTKWALNGVFFDFESDTLYLSRFAGDSQKNLFLRKVKRAELVQVQNLAAANCDILNVAFFSGLKKLTFLVSARMNRRVTLEAHDCGALRGDARIHEIDHFMAQYPEQQHYLKEVLNFGKSMYAHSIARLKRRQNWQEPEGYTVAYGMACDNGVQQLYWEL